MDPLNQLPAMPPARPRVRVFQSVLVIALFSLIPLWPADARASGPSVVPCTVAVAPALGR